MHRFWAQPLRRQLFTAIALLLVPVLAAAAWSGFTTLHEREDDLRNQARVAAITSATYVDSSLANIDQTASGLSLNPYIRQLDGPSAIPLLRSVVDNRRSILDIVLVRADGSDVAHGSSTAFSNDRRAGTAQVLDSGGRLVMPMEVTPDGLRYTCVGYPVRDDNGRDVGVLWFLVSLERMQRAFAALPLPPGSVVRITDASNRVLMRSLEPEKYVGQLLPEPEAASSPTGDWSISGDMDGVRRMHVRQPIPSGPWVLTVAIPMQVALAKANDVWARSFTILGVGLAGWLLVAITLSKRLSASVQYLVSAAQRITSGDFAPLQPRQMPSREFQALQHAFGQMLQRFNETKTALDRHLMEERRIRQELQSLQSQVIRQERLAAVGQLVSGVAHEINNPLQAILGFAELLQMQGDVPDSVKPDLRLIQKESARACAIIRNLAMFARQQPGEAAPVRLSGVITAVVELRQRQLESENIDLRLEDNATRPISAVLAELQQVALNFVVNAEQAIKLSGRLPGRITIRTYDAGEYVGLEVEDTGPGVPAEDEAKLFQPFFTTKPVGMGTGLGLSVSYGIIESLGGRIGHRNAVAGGATFYFELPAISEVEVGPPVDGRREDDYRGP
jgi:signal transduction histidine kinase